MLHYRLLKNFYHHPTIHPPLPTLSYLSYFFIIILSYFPTLTQSLVVEWHYNGVNNAGTAVEALGSQNLVDLSLFVAQLSLLLLQVEVAGLFLLLVGPDVEGIHEGEASLRLLRVLLLLFSLSDDSIFKHPDILRKCLYLPNFHGIGGGVHTSGHLKASPMEPVHAREDIKLLTEQSFEALFAFMTGVDLNASVFDHPQLVFQLLSIGGIAIHQILEFSNLR